MLRRDWRQDVHAGTSLKSVNQIASQSDFDWPRRVVYSTKVHFYTDAAMQFYYSTCDVHCCFDGHNIACNVGSAPPVSVIL